MQPVSACCSTPGTDSLSQGPPAWNVLHRVRGPWGCKAQRRVERATGVLSKNNSVRGIWTNAALVAVGGRLASSLVQPVGGVKVRRGLATFLEIMCYHSQPLQVRDVNETDTRVNFFSRKETG